MDVKSSLWNQRTFIFKSDHGEVEDKRMFLFNCIALLD